jgi:hypothetical protein
MRSTGDPRHTSWMITQLPHLCHPCCLPTALQISQNLHLWLRLPPLNPKAAAPLKRLTAGSGHLFAGPAGNEGQLLHWSPRLDDASTLPAGAAPCRTEDWDSAPAGELQPSSGSWSDGSSSKMAASAMCVDAAAGRLWCGFEDGSVHVWMVEAAAVAAAAGGHGSAAQTAVWLNGWKAHNGKVRSIVFTPAGHLFTGGCSTGVERLACISARGLPEQHAVLLLQGLLASLLAAPAPCPLPPPFACHHIAS